jgi:hypothetical protein
MKVASGHLLGLVLAILVLRSVIRAAIGDSVSRAQPAILAVTQVSKSAEYQEQHHLPGPTDSVVLLVLRLRLRIGAVTLSPGNMSGVQSMTLRTQSTRPSQQRLWEAL